MAVQLGGTSVQSLLCSVQSLLHNFAVCSLQSVRDLLLNCYNINNVTPSEINRVFSFKQKIYNKEKHVRYNIDYRIHGFLIL